MTLETAILALQTENAQLRAGGGTPAAGASRQAIQEQQEALLDRIDACVFKATGDVAEEQWARIDARLTRMEDNVLRISDVMNCIRNSIRNLVLKQGTDEQIENDRQFNELVDRLHVPLEETRVRIDTLHRIKRELEAEAEREKREQEVLARIVPTEPKERGDEGSQEHER